LTRLISRQDFNLRRHAPRPFPIERLLLMTYTSSGCDEFGRWRLPGQLLPFKEFERNPAMLPRHESLSASRGEKRDFLTTFRRPRHRLGSAA
jgi:hypothetical protein